jgi:hypothetical protein
MDVKKTITSIFIMPTLKIGRERLLGNGYINGYIKDEERDVQYQNAVYALFKPKKMDAFRSFLDEEYARTNQIIDDYDYPEGFVVLVYNLDEKFKSDFLLVKEGLYSKTSKEFQAQFPKIVKLFKNGLHKDEISLQYRVFNKTEDLKKYWEEKLGVEFDDTMEVWDGFNIDKESLNLNKIKQYV